MKMIWRIPKPSKTYFLEGIENIKFLSQINLLQTKPRPLITHFLIDFLRDYWTNYWQSVIDTITDIRSPAYTWLFLLIMIKIYQKFFL